MKVNSNISIRLQGLWFKSSSKYLKLENTLNKAILKNQLSFGKETAIGLLYARYGAMLFEFVTQFVPEKTAAEQALVTIFEKISLRLQEAFHSPLGVYCWMQQEARKILIEYRSQQLNEHNNIPCNSRGYLQLLQDSSEDHRRVFQEVYYNGKKKDELAKTLGMEPVVINQLLQECLLTIRKRLL